MLKTQFAARIQLANCTKLKTLTIAPHFNSSTFQLFNYKPNIHRRK
jgi:hypothetical protein